MTAAQVAEREVGKGSENAANTKYSVSSDEATWGLADGDESTGTRSGHHGTGVSGALITAVNLVALLSRGSVSSFDRQRDRQFCVVHHGSSNRTTWNPCPSHTQATTHLSPHLHTVPVLEYIHFTRNAIAIYIEVRIG